MDFSNYLLLSDLDGTLLKDDHTVSEKNRLAIREWMSKGGRFSIATGRSVLSAKKYADSLSVNYPVILFNGGALYDYKTQKAIWVHYLSEHYADLVKRINTNFPEIGIEIMTLDNIYILKRNEIITSHVDKEGLQYKLLTDYPMPKDAIKILFGVKAEKMESFVEEMSKTKDPEFTFVQTSPIYFEMLPTGINKGDALNKLKSLDKTIDLSTVAVGDYHNDIQMIQYADLGVATANALDIVKDKADLVVSSNNQHPIADVINYIKNRQSIIKEN